MKKTRKNIHYYYISEQQEGKRSNLNFLANLQEWANCDTHSVHANRLEVHSWVTSILEWMLNIWNHFNRCELLLVKHTLNFFIVFSIKCERNMIFWLLICIYFSFGILIFLICISFSFGILIFIILGLNYICHSFTYFKPFENWNETMEIKQEEHAKSRVRKVRLYKVRGITSWMMSRTRL